jgi:hypothetical protein
MRGRILPPAALSILLFALGPSAVRSGGIGVPVVPPTGGLAIPSGGGDPTPGEQSWIDALNAPGNSPEVITRWIGQVGQFGRSPTAIAELIRWLEFSPDWFRPLTVNSEPIPFHYPAQVALTNVGPVAAPQLVDEYLYFFENKHLAAWKGRFAALAGDRRNGGKPDEVQNPCFRLSALVCILTCDRAMAQKAVESARLRMRSAPWDNRIQRAGHELIGRIVSQFPEAERAKLFPPAVLAE